MGPAEILRGTWSAAVRHCWLGYCGNGCGRGQFWSTKMEYIWTANTLPWWRRSRPCRRGGAHSRIPGADSQRRRAGSVARGPTCSAISPRSWPPMSPATAGWWRQDEEGTLRTLGAYRAVDRRSHRRAWRAGLQARPATASWPSSPAPCRRCARGGDPAGTAAPQRRSAGGAADGIPHRHQPRRRGRRGRRPAGRRRQRRGPAAGRRRARRHLLSGAVREQIEGKLDLPAVALGERTLKNIPRPVPVYRVDWSAEAASAGGGAAAPARSPCRTSRRSPCCRSPI